MQQKLRCTNTHDLNPMFRGGHRDQRAAQKAEDTHINPPVNAEGPRRHNFPPFPDKHNYQTTKTGHNHLRFPPYRSCSLIQNQKQSPTFEPGARSMGEEPAGRGAAAQAAGVWAPAPNQPQLWKVMGWLCHPTLPRWAPRHPPPSWGGHWARGRVRHDAPPNHPSYPKEEITTISLPPLIILFISGAWTCSGCLGKDTVHVPRASQGQFLLFPFPKTSSCPWSVFARFPCL